MAEILMNNNKSKIIFWLFIILGVTGCQKDDGPSQREIALSFLTDNSMKHWVFDRSTVDGQAITPNVCDSAYVLVMKSDLTWQEFYIEFQCNQSTDGHWTLNDELDVISISYLNPLTGSLEERHFEIEELSEEYFAYQYAENNRLKFVRLKRGE